jgi:hypothetical protein
MNDLTPFARAALARACADVVEMAAANAHKRPKATTLLEEMAELVLALRGKHDDSPELELAQIASIAINMLWQSRAGMDINNIKSGVNL